MSRKNRVPILIAGAVELIGSQMSLSQGSKIKREVRQSSRARHQSSKRRISLRKAINTTFNRVCLQGSFHVSKSQKWLWCCFTRRVSRRHVRRHRKARRYARNHGDCNRPLYREAFLCCTIVGCLYSTRSAPWLLDACSDCGPSRSRRQFNSFKACNSRDSSARSVS